MMTSSNGDIFRVTGPLWGESTGHRWFLSQRPVTRSYDVLFDLRLENNEANNRDAGHLRRYGAHYDVTVMEAAKTLDRCWLDIDVDPRVSAIRARFSSHSELGQLMHAY